MEEFANLDSMRGKDITDSVHLWLGSMDQWKAAELPSDAVTAEEKANAQRYRFGHLRDRALISKALLRSILSKYTGMAPLELQIARSERGKPYLPQYPNLHFNLSHSKDMLLVGVTSISEIGVDIEAIDSSRGCAEVADRFFAGREKEKLNELSGEAYVSQFFHYWTRKEAFIKGAGWGLGLDLHSFEVCEDRVVLVSSTTASDPGLVGWHLHSFDPGAGFKAAAAVKEEDVQPSFLCLRWNTIE